MKSWKWLDERDALILHERLLVLHGGAPGVRDKGLLSAAIARPRQAAAYAKSPKATDLAALYTDGLVQNHPFVDGNKRTGFVLGILFLELNGMKFECAQEQAAAAVISLAAGEIDEKDYARFLKAHTSRA